MSLIPWSPFLDTFENLENSNFLPAIDVYENKDNVVVEATLAGIKPANINISVKDDVFTIEGQREETSEIEEKNYYRKEVRTGSFHRSVILPASVQADASEAIFENGLLKVTLPKEERQGTKNIKIEIKK
ncbi:MAG: Heat shock protein Hsp20 [Parcubacteria group bacterium GW2011_GWA2_36_10]|nr:MAG: Heat shock protein Hsp20 [Parcubacteria group bacterium GW2011_GWA2_36_10]